MNMVGITIGSEGSGGVNNITFQNIFYNSAASEAGAKRRDDSRNRREEERNKHREKPRKEKKDQE